MTLCDKEIPPLKLDGKIIRCAREADHEADGSRCIDQHWLEVERLADAEEYYSRAKVNSTRPADETFRQADGLLIDSDPIHEHVGHLQAWAHDALREATEATPPHSTGPLMPEGQAIFDRRQAEYNRLQDRYVDITKAYALALIAHRLQKD